MDKLGLMGYMWCRDMHYKDIDHYVDRLKYVGEIPTQAEFEDYCKREDKRMEEYFDGRK